jgi:hypothetical protein
MNTNDDVWPQGRARAKWGPVTCDIALPNASALPKFALRMLENLPRRGAGLHNALFRVARALHAFRSEEEIIELLRRHTHAEEIGPGEIEEAVHNSLKYAWRPGERNPNPRRQFASPKGELGLDPQLRQAIIMEHPFTLSDLMESSPERSDGPRQTEHVLDILFPGDPLLCAGRSVRDVATLQRSVWPPGRLERLSLIVPSPMKAAWGTTQDGRHESQRCLDNVGPRRYLVIDQDQGSEDEQAAVLHHLSGFLGLVLVVHSGGKSLHGWFFVEGLDIGWFMDLAVRLGADDSMKSPIQLARMPDGVRESGERQRILFFDPAARPPGGKTGRG